MSADSRRAARTAERVFNALAELALLAWIVGLLRENAEWLGWIAMGLLIKDGLRELMIGGENVAARLDLSLSRDGARGSFNNRPDDPGGDNGEVS